jgi:site-specific recombinase XerD
LNDVPGSLLNFTAEDIRDYLSDFQQKRQSSSVTVNNIRRIFSSFFSWLEQEDYIIKSPMRRIHKVKTGTRVKSTISDEEMETLRDHCNNKRDLAMIDFLASTGIRVGELVRLNRTDINFNERECIVSGKGNKQRIVYFNARAKTHLLNYLGERVDENPALFVSLHQPTERLRISGVETRLRKLGQETGVMHVHPHKFRRTLATAAIDRGMPVEQVQRLLGHVKIDTTMQYAMVNQNNVKMSHRRYLS